MLKSIERLLIHVGLALSKVDEDEARAALDFREGIGQAYADELAALTGSKVDEEGLGVCFVDEFRGAEADLLAGDPLPRTC